MSTSFKECQDAVAWVQSIGYIKYKDGSGGYLAKGMPKNPNLCAIQNFIAKNDKDKAGKPKCPKTCAKCSTRPGKPANAASCYDYPKVSSSCMDDIKWIASIGYNKNQQMYINKGMPVHPTMCEIHTWVNKHDKDFLGVPKCLKPCTTCKSRSGCKYTTAIDSGTDAASKSCKSNIDWVLNGGYKLYMNGANGYHSKGMPYNPTRCQVQAYIHANDKDGSGKPKCPPVCKHCAPPPPPCADYAKAPATCTGAVDWVASHGYGKYKDGTTGYHAKGMPKNPNKCQIQAYIAKNEKDSNGKPKCPTPCTSCSAPTPTPSTACLDYGTTAMNKATDCKASIDWVASIGYQKYYAGSNGYHAKGMPKNPNKCQIHLYIFKNDKNSQGKPKCNKPCKACSTTPATGPPPPPSCGDFPKLSKSCLGDINWVLKTGYALYEQAYIRKGMPHHPSNCEIQTYINKNDKDSAGIPKCVKPCKPCAKRATCTTYTSASAGCKSAVDWVSTTGYKLYMNGANGYHAKGMPVNPNKCQIQAFIHAHDKDSAGKPKCAPVCKSCNAATFKPAPAPPKCADYSTTGYMSAGAGADCKGSIDWVYRIGYKLYETGTTGYVAKGMPKNPNKCEIQAFIAKNDNDSVGMPKCVKPCTACGSTRGVYPIKVWHSCKDYKVSGKACQGDIRWVQQVGYQKYEASYVKQGMPIHPTSCEIQNYIYKNDRDKLGHPKCPKTCTACAKRATCSDYAKLGSVCKSNVDWVKSTGYAKYKAGAGGYHAKGMPVNPNVCQIQAYIHAVDKDAQGKPKCPPVCKICTTQASTSGCADYVKIGSVCKSAVDWVANEGYAKYKAGNAGYHAKGMPVNPSKCQIQTFISKNEKGSDGKTPKCPLPCTKCSTASSNHAPPPPATGSCVDYAKATGGCKAAIDWVKNTGYKMYMNGATGYHAKGMPKNPNFCQIQVFIFKNDKDSAGKPKCPNVCTACSGASSPPSPPSPAACKDGAAVGDGCKGDIDWVLKVGYAKYEADYIRKGMPHHPSRCEIQTYINKFDKDAIGAPKCPKPCTACAKRATCGTYTSASAGCKSAVDWVAATGYKLYMNGANGYHAKGMPVNPNKCQIQAFIHAHDKDSAGKPKCAPVCKSCNAATFKPAPTPPSCVDYGKASMNLVPNCKGSIDWVFGTGYIKYRDGSNGYLSKGMPKNPNKCQIQMFIFKNDKDALGIPKCPTPCATCSTTPATYGTKVWQSCKDFKDSGKACQGDIAWVKKSGFKLHGKQYLAKGLASSASDCQIQAYINKNDFDKVGAPKCPKPCTACGKVTGCKDYKDVDKVCKSNVDWVKSIGYKKYMNGATGYHAKGMPKNPTNCQIQAYIRANDKDAQGKHKCPPVCTVCGSSWTGLAGCIDYMKLKDSAKGKVCQAAVDWVSKEGYDKWKAGNNGYHAKGMPKNPKKCDIQLWIAKNEKDKAGKPKCPTPCTSCSASSSNHAPGPASANSCADYGKASMAKLFDCKGAIDWVASTGYKMYMDGSNGYHAKGMPKNPNKCQIQNYIYKNDKNAQGMPKCPKVCTACGTQSGTASKAKCADYAKVHGSCKGDIDWVYTTGYTKWKSAYEAKGMPANPNKCEIQVYIEKNDLDSMGIPKCVKPCSACGGARGVYGGAATTEPALKAGDAAEESSNTGLIIALVVVSMVGGAAGFGLWQQSQGADGGEKKAVEMETV